MAINTIYNEFTEQLHTYTFAPENQKILNTMESYFFSGESLEFSLIVPYIKQRLPMLNFDHILSDTIHVHAPFLNGPIDENNIRAGIERILGHFKEGQSLEAQERFKRSQNQADWARLKTLMAQKHYDYR